MFRLSDQIHRAYQSALSSGSIDGAESLVVRLRDFNAPEQERDELWTQLIDRYTSGPRQAWAAALLEVMRVDLLAALGALPAMPPAITRDDIAQQLVTEVLAAAMDGPTTPARWTRHRLVTRATTSVQRLLVDELRSATDEAELPPQPDGSLHVSMQLTELMVDIEAGRLPRKAVAILFRQKVLGESMAELAAEAGISFDAMRMQRYRSVAAIRRLLEAA
jgi:DNA-directed RNA polymerase specialized sigma24 family protein